MCFCPSFPCAFSTFMLPYAKVISANGCGELFVSERTLQLLSEWNPKADAKECKAILETNGSLFDKEHWDRISNLGNYDLRVSITVMSFEEPIYQYLSGCSLPVSQVEDNLRFVKGLREKGVINHLVIVNVVQEQNFRFLPVFVKRCIEEFGADEVKLRPYEPWGVESPDVAWSKDIRIPDHPLHDEYKRIMQQDIFKHPKCIDLSGGLSPEWASESPYKTEQKNKRMIVDMVINPNRLRENYAKRFGETPCVVYGLEAMGKVVSKCLLEAELVPEYIISYHDEGKDFFGMSVFRLKDLDYSLSRDVVVIITQSNAKKTIMSELSILGYERMVTIDEIMNDI